MNPRVLSHDVHARTGLRFIGAGRLRSFDLWRVNGVVAKDETLNRETWFYVTEVEHGDVRRSLTPDTALAGDRAWCVIDEMVRVGFIRNDDPFSLTVSEYVGRPVQAGTDEASALVELVLALQEQR